MVTLLDLKKAKMNALKTHDENAQNVLGIIISAYQKMQIDKQGKGQQMTDADMVSVLNKTLKELSDEKEMYEENGRKEQADADAKQMEIVKSYLPKMMSEDEIQNFISEMFTDIKSMNKKEVIPPAMKALKGKADGKMINAVIAKMMQ